VIDWNKMVLIIAQCVVVVVLGVLVGLGYDSTITDGLLAVSGSMAGIGIFQTVSKIKKGS
jgi:high-affinity nickel permease